MATAACVSQVAMALGGCRLGIVPMALDGLRPTVYL